jgi:hypothetical protein
MVERDYLMRQLLLLFQAISKSWQQKQEDDDPLGAAQTLEDAISASTDLDGEALLSLSPDSIAQVMDISGVDPKVVSYIAHSMLLESDYLVQGGNPQLASVRKAQAKALSRAYDFDLPDDPADFVELDPKVDVDSEADEELSTGEEFTIDDLEAMLNA